MATTAKQATAELPTMADLTRKLVNIQSRLKAPKKNETKKTDGKILYKYRSCEEILEALKPLLAEHGCYITMADIPIPVGTVIFMEAKVTISDGYNSISNVSHAQHAVSRAGMDVSQITGATISYARKNALGGLFAIDDNKDADAMDNSVLEHSTEAGQLAEMSQALKEAKNRTDITRIYNYYGGAKNEVVKDACCKRADELGVSLKK